MKSRKRVLFIDNIAVEALRRSAYRALASSNEFEVHLAVPRRWREQGDALPFEQEVHAGVMLHPVRTMFTNRQHRVLYPGLFGLLHRLHPEILCVDTEPENFGAVEVLLLATLSSRHTKVALVSSRTLDHRQIGFPYRLSYLHKLCDSIIRQRKVDLLFIRPRSAFPLMSDYAEDVVELPHPVDCSVFRKAVAPATDRPLTVGYLGRLAEGKGIPLLIEAMQTVPEFVQLLIVGSGPLGPSLAKIAEGSSLTGRVSFLPAVRYAEVPAILNRMDILLLPSVPTKYWNEQFGRVLIEAMACEVPVLASDSAGIPDVVGNAGMLFRTGDLSDLSAKLLQLINDPALRRTYQRLGRERALRYFDAPVIAEQMAAAFNTILRKG